MADATYDIRFTQTGAEAVSGKFGKVESAAMSMGKAFAAAAAGLFATQGLINGFKTSIALAQEQERVERKLQKAVGGSIGYWKDYASSIQRASNYGDELILNQLSQLKSMGLTSKQMRDVIGAAVDLAATTDMDLSSATRNLAKTYSGLAGELGEMIPQLRSLTAEQLRAGDGIAVVAEAYKGMGEAAADALIQQQNVFSDLGEELGSVLKPIAEFVAGDMLAFIEGLKEIPRLTNEMVGFSTGLSDIDKEAIAIAQSIKEMREEARGAFVGPTIELDEYAAALKSLAEEAIPEQEARVVESIIEEMDARYAVREAMQEEMAARNEAHAAEMAMFDLEIEAQAQKQEMFLQHIQARAEAQKAANIGAVSDMIGSFGQLNQALKGNAELTKRMMQAQAIIDTYAGANRALGAYPPPFSFIAAAAVVASGLANVAQIQQQNFALGGSIETAGPADIVTAGGRYRVGDNPGGRESIDITPSSSSNRFGPRGATINIQFMGPITNEQYVRDVIAPQVVKAARSA